MSTLRVSALVVLVTAASVSAQDLPITIRAGRLLDGVDGVVAGIEMPGIRCLPPNTP